MLGAAYGERGLAAGFLNAAGALVWGLKAADWRFRQRHSPGFEPDRWRCAPFVRRIGALRTRWLGRCGRSNRSAVDRMNGHLVMRPVSSVVPGIVESRHAGTSRRCASLRRIRGMALAMSAG